MSSTPFSVVSSMYEYTVVGLHCQLAGTNPISPYCLVLSNSCFPSISGLPCLLFLPASSPAACYTSHAPLNAPLVLRIVDRSSGSTASVLRLSGLRQQRLLSDSSRSLSLSNSQLSSLSLPLSLFYSSFLCSRFRVWESEVPLLLSALDSCFFLQIASS